MHAHISVTFLETAVFANKMQVVTTNDNGTLHFRLTNNSGQDASTDPHIAGERTFLINVSAINCLAWGLKSQTNITVTTKRFLLRSTGLELLVQVNTKLFLEGPLVLVLG